MKKIKSSKDWNDYLEEGKTIQDLSEEEKKELRDRANIPPLLKMPDLLEIINKEFDKFIVSEEETRKAIFICGCGAFVKNLNSTFNILINGESSAGKSWITRNVLNIFPEDVFSERTYRTRISPSALTYWHNSKVEPEWTWDGKILYLEDIGSNILNCDVFKVMISEGSTSTIVGRKKGKEYELPATFDIKIKGKPITFLTTASRTPIEEIKNRVFLIDLDESKEQTERIMKFQVKLAINGKLESYDEEIKNSLKYLKRVEVIIPDWIEKVINFIPKKDILRWRREFPRFLEIVKCSASLHQFQRIWQEDRVIANEQDYEIAKQVIGKISASSGIEGLTHREKMAYEMIKSYFKKFGSGCTRAEIYAYKPIYSDKQWYSILNNLSEKGLLTIKLEINPDSNRKANHYYPIEFGDFSLPPFKVLMEVMEVMALPMNTTSKEGGISQESVKHMDKEFTTITSTLNKFKCPSCDLEVYEEDWNFEAKTCIFCNPIKLSPNSIRKTRFK